MAGHAYRSSGFRNRLPEVLTEEELTHLVRQANRRAPTGVRNLAMLLCMGRCGLRVGEVIALDLKDVTRDSLHVWQGKGAKDRTVPLDLQTAQAIEAWREVRRRLRIRSHTLFTTITEREEGQATGLLGGPASCATEPGRPVSPQYCRQMVPRYARRAGIDKRVHPHTLRHTAATNWLRHGFNLREVQEMLGHSSATTTEIYTHVFDADLQRKQQALPPLEV